jgi:hypothetical protein
MLVGMQLVMAVRTEQEAAIQFRLQDRPGSRVPLFSDAEGLSPSGVVERQRVNAPVVPASGTFAALVSHTACNFNRRRLAAT